MEEGTLFTTLQIVLLCILALPALYLAAVCGYLFIITIGAWLFWVRVNYQADPVKAALLIPAHNEEHHIRYILSDAMTMDYPPSKFTVFVIADNCTDATAQKAREMNATVFERHDLAHRGKGQALDWCLRTFHDQLAGFDIIALVDADMQIHPRFLRELAASYSAGARVVQALNTVAKPNTNWRTALGYVGFSVINHVRPSGRRFFGGTAELKGSGMAFDAPLLLEYGWPAHSVAEDAEFSKHLLLDGIMVEYNPRALVTSEIPTTTYQARIQQQRWEGGKWHLQQKYIPLLLRAFLQKPSIPRLDALLDIIVPPQSILFGLILGSFLLSIPVHPALTAFFGACGLAVAFCILSGLALTRAPLGVWLSLLFVPVLLIWKIPVYARVLAIKGAHAWHRTPRDVELESEESNP